MKVKSVACDPGHRIQVRGARVHNLRNIDVDLPRNALIVFTGIFGSEKSSPTFGALFAESQRRYLDSVSPYARRLIDQVGEPDVDFIDGPPPAVALQQQRGTPSARSSGAASLLSPTVCACSIRMPGNIRAARRCCMRTRSRQTRGREPTLSVTASVACLR